MDIKTYLLSKKKLVERSLLKAIPHGSKYTKSIHDAVKYSLMSGGKRIRPILVMEACNAVSGSYKKAIPMAVAVEMIHTYSLIHDDLPAMDDDDQRRGKPTCHKKFGEDIAILAGDMLNTLAFEIIADNYPSKSGLLVKELSHALGIDGVVGGQVADIKSVKRKIGPKELEFICTKKTAYLFYTSLRCGAIAGGAKNKVVDALGEYALHMGLAFQIIDDILDHRKGDKNDYPAVLGMDGAKKAAQKHLGSAIRSLPKENKYGRLRDIALVLSKRKK